MRSRSFLNNIKMKPKLIGLFLIVGLIPLIVVAIFSMARAQSAMTQQAYNNLEAVHETKRAQIESYFEERQGDIGVLVETVSTLSQEAFAKLEAVQAIHIHQIDLYFETIENMVHVLKNNPTTAQAIEAFEEGFEAKGGTTGGTQWTAAEEEFGTVFEGIVEDFGYYDVFLIAAGGDVIYTVAKESDLGENLLEGNLRDSGLAKAFRAAASGEELDFEDFAPYAPSGDRPEAFVAGPVMDASGTFVGVIAIQVPADEINHIVQERTGMGQTGETYLVGRWEGTNSLRSDRVVKSGKIGDAKSDVYIERALSGESGQAAKTGSTGDMEVVIYSPLDILGANWCIITTMNLEEAIAPQLEGETEDFYAKYIAKYGYYDLFLINPDGYVLYTVNQEPDYQTNMLSGTYSSSNLGKLVKEVLETRQFGFADFEQYAPSNDEPAAFIAQPAFQQGELEVIVALQLPLEGVNSIMGIREGMGQSGEAYLVGPDNRMRSDSYLDPTGRSVTASFAGTVVANGVDTEATTKALAGEDGQKVIIDYNGNPVLSSYGPVDVYDTTWALMAEIDQAEVNAPSNQLRNIVLLIGVVAAVIVAVVAFFVATSIANPIQKITALARLIAAGDLSQRVDIVQGDEIGQLADAFREMGGALNAKADVARQIAEGNLAIEVPVASKVDTLGNAMVIMKDNLSAMARQTREATRNITTATSQILAATNEQASTASEQATAVSETSSTVQESRQTAEQAAERARMVSEAAQESAGMADQGLQAVQDTVAGMNDIREQVGTIAETILTLSEQTQQIGEIIALINNIADQSYLLSVNASIEAARAGEAGKGFAVVAGEVSSLAEQSRQATDQVRDILGEIQKAANTAVMVTEEGTKRAEAGMQRAQMTGEAINAISEQIQRVSLAADQIAASSSQQLVGMDQIASAMESVNQATAQTEAGTRQVEQAAQSLNALATQLTRIVEQYKLE